MIGLILVTHGRLADQFVEAMEHVVGPQDGIVTVCIGPNDDMEQRRADIAAAILAVDTGSGVIILTDLFGGTPSNLAISLLNPRPGGGCSLWLALDRLCRAAAVGCAAAQLAGAAATAGGRAGPRARRR